MGKVIVRMHSFLIKERYAVQILEETTWTAKAKLTFPKLFKYVTQIVMEYYSIQIITKEDWM